MSGYKYIPKSYKFLYQSVFTFIEYSSFAVFFLFSADGKRFRTTIIFLSICFVIFQIIFTFTTDLNRLDSIPVGFETILVFIYTFCFFYQEFKKENQLLIRNPMFWISIGIFFYLAGSFFFNILANQLSEEIMNNWYYTYLFDIIKNIFIAVGLVLYKRKEEKNSLPYLDIDWNKTTKHQH